MNVESMNVLCTTVCMPQTYVIARSDAARDPFAVYTGISISYIPPVYVYLIRFSRDL